MAVELFQPAPSLVPVRAGGDGREAMPVGDVIPERGWACDAVRRSWRQQNVLGGIHASAATYL